MFLSLAQDLIAGRPRSRYVSDAMLDQIIKFLTGPDLTRPSQADEGPRLAIAALLVEAAKSDGVYRDGERFVVAGLLRRLFGIEEEAAARLVAAAEQALDQSAQLFRFTRPIVEQVPPEQRAGIIELLWETVYADRILTADEDSLVRRVAGLLYVSDRDRGAARLRVLKRLGIPE
jgi:uncharacterized tellurite resistance protein B-like protein